MIERLKAWLTEEQGELSGGRDELQLAVAALLMEAAAVGNRLSEAERSVVRRLLERRFGLSENAADALALAGERRAQRSTQLFGFARTINERCSPERRRELIEMLWEVAYADGGLDPLEDAMLRTVGGLIDVSDHERGEARIRVLRRLGIAETGQGRPRISPGACEINDLLKEFDHDLCRHRGLHQVQISRLRRSLSRRLLL